MSLNLAISACETGEQWQEALSLLGRSSSMMQGQLLTPDSLSWSAAISACGESEQWIQNTFWTEGPE